MSTVEKRHSDPERAQTRRQQVLDAAETCFRRSGFHGASMAEISKAAGMSAGHIYNYFDSKDAIIAAFVEQNVERVTAIMRNLEQQEDPLQAIVDDTARSVREHLERDTWALPLEISAEAARNPTIAAVVRDADARSRGQLRAMLKTARERHHLPVDDFALDGLVELVITLYQGLGVRVVHHPDLDAEALIARFRATLKALLFS
ncbi:TetR/AcrR family transcriptional regulator [Pseudoduganella namucuonensis]|uniref:Transcriptional regulator, TetR family n=1 Tax=Pseudoduganella namucuonensis TaxID=1035707 RepID=A0A1I7IY14_9BURK|nr:TetR/AcrR family transcriptional regulator [Pseudoduganella namucuonensis]SFU77843.1 transcriptional regulator, TetR family [Pseudoduganella namucuonensis]